MTVGTNASNDNGARAGSLAIPSSIINWPRLRSASSSSTTNNTHQLHTVLVAEEDVNCRTHTMEVLHQHQMLLREELYYQWAIAVVVLMIGWHVWKML